LMLGEPLPAIKAVSSRRGSDVSVSVRRQAATSLPSVSSWIKAQ
jgi:hypothetical protein